MRAVTALAVAAAWTAAVTGFELALAPWAPLRTWAAIAAVNAAIAFAVAFSLFALLRGRHPRFLVAALAVAFGLSLLAVPANVRGRGAVVWVVCDTLRADAMSLYGYERETTPFLESWSPELAVFDRAYSQASHTLITAPALLASLHPSTHALRHPGHVLDPRAELVSEILRDRGYATFGVISNPNLRKSNGFDQGWDRFQGADGWGPMSSDRINRELFRWRRARPDGAPWFALLWYIDPHTPFQWDPAAASWAGVSPWDTAKHKPALKDASAPPEMRRETRVFYEAPVRRVDRTLQRLVEYLKAPGDYDDALIVFPSDHGESLWEHGRFGHNYGLYESLTHVPLVIRFPPPLRFPAFRSWTGRSETIASSVDVLPTMLDALGIDGGESMQGRSLLPDLVSGDAGSAYLEQRLHHYGPYEIFGIRDERFKYIRIEQFDGDGRTRELLFDLEADPEETVNVASELPDIAARYQERVRAKRRDYEALALDATEGTIDAETRRQLEHLGYVDP